MGPYKVNKPHVGNILPLPEPTLQEVLTEGS